MIKKIKNFLLNKILLVKISVVIFYLVGAIGILSKNFNELFLSLTPYALIFTFIILMLYHNTTNPKKNILLFSIIYFLGYLIEVIGVNTGYIFGEYQYGNSLGLKFLGTPLIIGLNWLFLVYVSLQVVDRLFKNNIIVILISSFVMLLYDIILEQIAPSLDYWYWKDNIVPLQNYIDWFFIAIVFNSLVKIFKLSFENPIAKTILFTQFFYFIVLNLFYHIL